MFGVSSKFACFLRLPLDMLVHNVKVEKWWVMVLLCIFSLFAIEKNETLGTWFGLAIHQFNRDNYTVQTRKLNLFFMKSIIEF